MKPNLSSLAFALGILSLSLGSPAFADYGSSSTSTTAISSPLAESTGPADAFFLELGKRKASFTLDSWRFAADAQVRPRMLGDSGRDFIDSGAGDSNVRVTMRSRLGVAAAHREGWAVRVMVQDIRVWGEEGDANGFNDPNSATLNDFSAAGLDLQEGYLRIPITDDLRITLGRQEIGYDNERILGKVDWSQRARALDAARLTYSRSGFVGEFVYAKLLQQPLPFELDGTIPDREDDADFISVHLHYPVLAEALEANVSYYMLDDGVNNTSRHTLGTYLKGATLGLNYDAEFYYQFGDIGPRPEDETISAWMVAGTAGYTLDLGVKLNLTGRFEALSGDGTPQGAFDPFFGTNHKFYGEADYFLVLPAQTNNLGLLDPGFEFKVTLMPQLVAGVNVHFFIAMESDAQNENYFGTEIDFTVTWRLTEFSSISGVYGPFWPGEAMRFRSGAATQPEVGLELEHFGYVTVDLQI